mmetsp:Transcript_1105/g.2418  ORF Transcript_1105/g.2418 Transcript_1105/m.2418 type:complete len:91 (-) Transcript_1105:61-333(-)
MGVSLSLSTPVASRAGAENASFIPSNRPIFNEVDCILCDEELTNVKAHVQDAPAIKTEAVTMVLVDLILTGRGRTGWKGEGGCSVFFVSK